MTCSRECNGLKTEQKTHCMAVLSKQANKLADNGERDEESQRRK